MLTHDSYPACPQTVIGSILLCFNILVVAYFVLQYVYEYILGESSKARPGLCPVCACVRVFGASASCP